VSLLLRHPTYTRHTPKIKRIYVKRVRKTNKKGKIESTNIFFRCFYLTFLNVAAGALIFRLPAPARPRNPGRDIFRSRSLPPLASLLAARTECGRSDPLARKSLPAAAFCTAKHVHFWCTFLCGSLNTICSHEESNPVTHTHSTARIHFTF
jgi:hypothetical protein